jgi:small subunit ribosomal protein S2
MPQITVEDLMNAGVHFGHQTNRWNPRMKKHIFEARHGIHIIDITQTVEQIKAATAFLHKIVREGGDVLFVGTKKQAQETIKEAALKCRQHFVIDRWLGGTLTNQSTIRNSIKRMDWIESLETSNQMAKMHKKEVSQLRRELARLHKNLIGIRRLQKAPSALFIVDIVREHIAVKEAKKLRVPIVAMVDTNANPDLVQYPIVSNDDAIRAVKLIVNHIADDLAIARAHFEKSHPDKPDGTPQSKSTMSANVSSLEVSEEAALEGVSD